jgi:hypothetical protein
MISSHPKLANTLHNVFFLIIIQLCCQYQDGARPALFQFIFVLFYVFFYVVLCIVCV